MNCQEESYKLYKQGKTILEIASILKIDENQVKQNIIIILEKIKRRDGCPEGGGLDVRRSKKSVSP